MSFLHSLATLSKSNLFAKPSVFPRKVIRKADTALSLGLAVIVMGTLCLRAADDPVVKGRHLSDWLDDFSNSRLAMEAVPAEVSQRSHEAAATLREMGTNVIPTLIKIIREPTANRVDAMKGLQSQAAKAIGLFGEQAKFAIPDLLVILKAEDANAYPAAEALSGIGPAAIVLLSEVLTNSNQRLHLTAASALVSICARSYGQAILSNAVPALSVVLRSDRDLEVRKQVAQSLYGLGLPNSIVPAMLQALSDTNAYVRQQIISALPRYDFDEATAITRLERIRDYDPDEGVRIVAGRTLGELEEHLKWKSSQPAAK